MDGYIIIAGIICIFGLAKIISSGYKHSYTEKEKALSRIESARRADYNKRLNELSKKEQTLEKQRKQLERQAKQQEQSLAQKAESLSYREVHINEQVRQRFADTVMDLARREYLSSTLVFHSLLNSADKSRLVSALSQDMRICQPFEISSRVLSESGEIYNVTLHSCSCRDFAIHHQPCKHMYRLAAEVGALLAYDTATINEQVLSLNQQAIEAESIIAKARSMQETAEKEMDAVKKTVSENSQKYPWLAKMYADCFYALDEDLESRIQSNSNTLSGAKALRKRLALENRALRAQNKAHEYQLHFYESMFPWLEDFKEVPPVEAYQSYLAVNEDETAKSEYDTLRNWLSHDEYARLSTAEKYQLALDRYQRRPKSNWDIGVEYERYIGYLCEQRGYKVVYTGANLRLEDMGRDLILSKGDSCCIIQCKRWAKEKTIHEKHIFQLFGSCVLFEMQNPKYTSVTGTFVTSTTLSPVARQCAERLHIQVYENISLGEFPMIKCNISKDGEKIYHLPFDQQYDRVVINPERGEFFAHTVSEAENAGFRRALRHRK